MRWYECNGDVRGVADDGPVTAPGACIRVVGSYHEDFCLTSVSFDRGTWMLEGAMIGTTVIDAAKIQRGQDRSRLVRRGWYVALEVRNISTTEQPFRGVLVGMTMERARGLHMPAGVVVHFSLNNSAICNGAMGGDHLSPVPTDVTCPRCKDLADAQPAKVPEACFHCGIRLGITTRETKPFRDNNVVQAHCLGCAESYHGERHSWRDPEWVCWCAQRNAGADTICSACGARRGVPWPYSPTARWNCARCGHWTPVARYVCVCCGRTRATNDSVHAACARCGEVHGPENCPTPAADSERNQAVGRMQRDGQAISAGPVIVHYILAEGCYCEAAPPRGAVESTVVSLDGSEGGQPVRVPLVWSARMRVAWERHEFYWLRVCRSAWRPDHDALVPSAADAYGGTVVIQHGPGGTVGMRCCLCGAWARRVVR